METLCFDDLPLFGVDSTWQFDADYTTSNSGADLSGLLFDADRDFVGPEPPVLSSESMDSTLSASISKSDDSLSQPDPVIFSNQTFDLIGTMGSDLWEDLVSCSSSSSQLSPLTGATKLSSSTSVNSDKCGADAVHSKSGSFRLPKRQRSREAGFRQIYGYYKPDAEAVAKVKEMIYRAAAMRPVNLGREVIEEKPRRKNVRISNDPQTAAARQRRERLSERLRALQRLVPGGAKMDTATMLDEAANYLMYLKKEISAMELDIVFPKQNTLQVLMKEETKFIAGRSVGC